MKEILEMKRRHDRNIKKRKEKQSQQKTELTTEIKM